MVGGRPALLADLVADEAIGRRLCHVLGASVALNQHLGVHAEDADVLRGPVSRRDALELRTVMLEAVGADPDSHSPVAEPVRSDDLRRTYRREVLRIAGRDLAARTRRLHCRTSRANSPTWRMRRSKTALALARGEVPGWPRAHDSASCALGKTGGQELNYVSDVDVLYIASSLAGRVRRNRRAPPWRGDCRGDRAGRCADQGLFGVHRRWDDLGDWTRHFGPRARPGRWSGRWPRT